MSQDGKTLNMNGMNGQAVGVVTIAVGFALLIGAYVVQNNLWLMIPVIMLEVGIYGMAMGAFSQLRGPSSAGRWGNDATYSLFWGSMIAVLGSLWIVYDYIANPGALAAIVAAFLFYFGIAVLLVSRNKSARPRVW